MTLWNKKRSVKKLTTDAKWWHKIAWPLTSKAKTIISTYYLNMW